MLFTYILRCADDTLYVGHTEALASREQIHNEGKPANMFPGTMTGTYRIMCITVHGP
jgi:predicted GIY-YIG superfamily endonuclease